MKAAGFGALGRMSKQRANSRRSLGPDGSGTPNFAEFSSALKIFIGSLFAVLR